MKKVSYLLSLGLIYPLGILPFPILYRVSDLIYVILYYLVGYRRAVVRSNLENAFPGKTSSERLRIEKKFYRNLCDLLLESFKTFTITRAQLLRRCRYINPEITYFHHDKRRSIILITAHYGNWEWAGLASTLFFRHQSMAVYKPLSNPGFDQWVKKRRSRFGMKLVPMDQAGGFIRENMGEPYISVFIADQSPAVPDRAHWVDFLKQDTPVQRGAETYAKRFDQSVLYGHIQRVSRGYYEMTLEPVCEDAQSTAEGEITERHTRILEKHILAQPEFWLWSHRRWKHKRIK